MRHFCASEKPNVIQLTRAVLRQPWRDALQWPDAESTFFGRSLLGWSSRNPGGSRWFWIFIYLFFNGSLKWMNTFILWMDTIFSIWIIANLKVNKDTQSRHVYSWKEIPCFNLKASFGVSMINVQGALVLNRTFKEILQYRFPCLYVLLWFVATKSQISHGVWTSANWKNISWHAAQPLPGFQWQVKGLVLTRRRFLTKGNLSCFVLDSIP